MNLPLIRFPTVKEAFVQYVEWLILAAGSRRAALRVNKDIDFFVTLDNTWSFIPTFDQLLSHYGTSGLRRLQLPVRWLRESNLITIDAAKKTESSESRRISNLLSQLPDASRGRLVAESYVGELLHKVATHQISIRTARLSARPAIALLQEVPAHAIPDQDHVTAYLTKTPGQANSLLGFLRFLNRSFSTNLKPVLDSKAIHAARRKRLERKLKILSELDTLDDAKRLEWIVVGLEYFHRILITHKQAKDAEVIEVDDGWIVRQSGMVFWLPFRKSISRRSSTSV